MSALFGTMFNGLVCAQCNMQWFEDLPCCEHPALKPPEIPGFPLRSIYITNFSLAKAKLGKQGEFTKEPPRNNLPYKKFKLVEVDE